MTLSNNMAAATQPVPAKTKPKHALTKAHYFTKPSAPTTPATRAHGAFPVERGRRLSPGARTAHRSDFLINSSADLACGHSFQTGSAVRLPTRTACQHTPCANKRQQCAITANVSLGTHPLELVHLWQTGRHSLASAMSLCCHCC